MKHSLTLSPDSPVRALFTMDSDDMEPLILRGEALSLAFELPKIGQVGLFRLGSETLVRQYCEDSFGTVYLLAARRDDPSLDRVIPTGQGPVLCLGRILMENDPPLPLGLAR